MANKKRKSVTTHSYTGYKPVQKKSFSQKIANDFEWAKQTIDYYAGISGGSDFEENRERLQEYYELYNNKVPDRFFEYITNPLSTDKSEHQNFPAEIREYTILRPNMDMIFGEFRKRPFVASVDVHNPDAVNRMVEKQEQEILRNLQSMFVEEVDPQGRPIEQPENIKKEFNLNYKDARAIQGQFALDYIIDFARVKMKLNEGFKDWAIAGSVLTYKGVHNDDIVYKRINPLQARWDSSKEFMEDGEFFVYDMGEKSAGMNISDVIDLFGEEMSDHDIMDLEERLTGSGNNGLSAHSRGSVSALKSYSDLGDKCVEVIHVVWKSFRKVFIIDYVDPITGEIETTEVDESFNEADFEGIDIISKSHLWINEVWEGYRVDGDKYYSIRPLPYQRNEMSNNSVCKLPYNGRNYSDSNSENISVLKLGIPYQVLFITIMYNIEKLLNKNKGKLLLIDKAVIPHSNGWDEEKFFYYADALGYALIDRKQAGVDKGFNQYQVLDMSTIAQVGELIKVLEMVEMQWDKTLGITPQRKGQNITSSSAVGATERAVFQSSIISEEMFGRFDEFVQTELTGLLDLSKHAWRDGKKAMFIGNETRSLILDSDPFDYVSSDFGVTVSNSTNKAETINQMKDLVQPFAQNGQSPETLLEILQANNPSKLKDILKDAQDKAIEMAQQSAQSEQEFEQQKMQIEQQSKQMEFEFETALMNLEYDRKERIELIRGEFNQLSFQNTNDADNDGVPDSEGVQDRALEREKVYTDRALKEREMNLKAETEKYKADTQLKVAKENKNKYDVKSKK